MSQRVTSHFVLLYMFADLNVRTTLFVKIEFKIVEMCFSLAFLGLLQFVLRSDHLLDFFEVVL